MKDFVEIKRNESDTVIAVIVYYENYQNCPNKKEEWQDAKNNKIGLVIHTIDKVEFTAPVKSLDGHEFNSIQNAIDEIKKKTRVIATYEDYILETC